MAVHYRRDRSKWEYRFMRFGKIYSGLRKTEAEACEAEREARLTIGSREKKDLSYIYTQTGVPDVQGKFGDLACPSVYAIVRWNEVLYVGQSSYGIGRPVDTRHHLRLKFRHTDSVLIWRCGSLAAARRLEAELISVLKPTLNIAQIPERRGSYIKDSAGKFSGSFGALPKGNSGNSYAFQTANTKAV